MVHSQQVILLIDSGATHLNFQLFQKLVLTVFMLSLQFDFSIKCNDE